MIVRRIVWSAALAVAVGAGSLAPPRPAAGVEDLEAVVDQRVEANQAGAQSQGRIDTLADDTEKMSAEYRGLLKQIAAVRVYDRQIDELISSQQAETVSLQAQIDEVEQVGRQVTPLMLEMIEALDLFVKLDTPFLPSERQMRLAGLKEMMTRADVTDAERFRRILETYQIESEYGRTIEAYAGELEVDGGTRTVEFLRVGRIVLIYQTRDREEMGVWDQESRSWQPLDSSYRSAVRQGLQMARKQTAPDLLRLPVPTAKAAR
ncbi:MAG: DUF3450 domain-containing protein [Myxococcales bacterium]|nr:MAG: DUF3450 domain-containing protein [Myxococcales bacterium]